MFRFIRLRTLVSLLAAFEIGAIGRSAADDWPMPRHDSRNTGRSVERVGPPLRLLWRAAAAANGDLLSSGGIVAVTKGPPAGSGGRGTVLYDRLGKAIWQLPDAVPLYVRGDRVIVSKDEAHASTLECHNWKRNAVLWSVPLGGQVQNPWGAVEREGRLYWAFTIGTWNQERQQTVGDLSVLKVFAVADGKLIVETNAKTLGGDEAGWGSGPPAVDDRFVYWGISHWLHRLDPGRLKPAAEVRYDGGNFYVIAAGDVLVAKGWLDYMQTWDLRTNRKLWKIGTPRETAHSVVPGRAGRQLVVESSSAIDLKTGKTAVRYRLGETSVYAKSMAGSGDLVYMAGTTIVPNGVRGGFYCFEAATGRFRWKYEKPGLNGAQVIVSGGRVHGLGSDGFVYAFGPAVRRARVRITPIPARRRGTRPTGGGRR